MSESLSENGVKYVNILINNKLNKVPLPETLNTEEVFVMATPSSQEPDKYVFHVYALSPMNSGKT